MTGLLRIPMFGFALLTFLALGVIVAIACWLVFNSGEHGKNKLSTPAGCAIGCGLLGFACFGAIGFLLVSFVDWQAQAVQHGPFRSLRFRWDRDRHALAQEDGDRAPAPGDEAPTELPSIDLGYRARLIVELRGSPAELNRIVGRISGWLRENTDGEFSVSTTSSEGALRVEWGLPVRGDDVRRLKDELEQEIGGLQIPDDVEVTFDVKDPDE
ncbi:MAG: hypothetical protein ACKVWV_04165 [Planctomycetota bacterium]